jgi:thymidylate synthase (FAD)
MLEPKYYKEISPLGKPIIEYLLKGASIPEPSWGLNGECIDLINRLGYHQTSFYLCSAIKYLWRLGQKSSTTISQDVSKICTYLQWEIDRDIWFEDAFLQKAIKACHSIPVESYLDRINNHRSTWYELLATLPINDPLKDGLSAIQLVDVMGRDLSVVNDARASFGRESTEMSAKDEKLINYLASATPPHSSPFRGCVLKFKIKAPLFLARQWYKHSVASSHLDDQNQWNEQSFRYTEVAQPEFYLPQTFRSQSTDNRQASGEDLPDTDRLRSLFVAQYTEAATAYQIAIAAGVAREQARMLLPPAIYTTWTWTVSLQALLHFIKLRKGDGAQTEIKAYAAVLAEMVQELFPVVYSANLCD